MKTPHRHPIAPLLLSFIFMLLCLPAYAAVFTYDFENLTSGGSNLAGQDNWTYDSGANFVVTTDGLANGSKVIGTNGSGSSNFVFRTNDVNFSFGDLSGNPLLTLGFDGRFVGGGSDQAHFALRNSTGTNNTPVFGFEANTFKMGASSAVLPGSINADDWVRMQMVMDMNLGTASLYYKNITDGDAAFTAVSGLQNVAFSGLNPSSWTQMILRTGFNANNKIDNLYIEASAVPEPSRALFAVLGLCGVILRRRR